MFMKGLLERRSKNRFSFDVLITPGQTESSVRNKLSYGHHEAEAAGPGTKTRGLGHDGASIEDKGRDSRVTGHQTIS